MHFTDDEVDCVHYPLLAYWILHEAKIETLFFDDQLAELLRGILSAIRDEYLNTLKTAGSFHRDSISSSPISVFPEAPGTAFHESVEYDAGSVLSFLQKTYYEDTTEEYLFYAGKPILLALYRALIQFLESKETNEGSSKFKSDLWIDLVKITSSLHARGIASMDEDLQFFDLLMRRTQSVRPFF